MSNVIPFVRRCHRADCAGEDGKPRKAVASVVLLLVPHRGYAGKPWRFPTNVLVCEEHQDRMADSFLTGDVWEQIVLDFDRRGAQRPHRTSTRAEFVPLEKPGDES